MTLNIETVGIIGAGQMGAGIAEVAAQAGLKVSSTTSPKSVSTPRSRPSTATCPARCPRDRWTRGSAGQYWIASRSPRRSTSSVTVISWSRRLPRTKTSSARLQPRSAPFSSPDAIVASNSCRSRSRARSVTSNPERFIGIHFMNLVPRMQLVELIRGIATKDDTFEAAKAFVVRLGKTATMSEDFPAFIVNRILLPMINEAVYTLYEGVGLGRGDRHRDAPRRQSSNGAAGSSPTSSGSTPASPSCRCCTKVWRIRNTAPARSW